MASLREAVEDGTDQLPDRVLWKFCSIGLLIWSVYEVILLLNKFDAANCLRHPITMQIGRIYSKFGLPAYSGAGDGSLHTPVGQDVC